MSERHWSSDDFVDAVYGIGPEDGHTDRCGVCRARLRAAEEKQRSMMAAPEVPFALLAAQRRAIYGRIEDPASARVRIPVGVVVALASVVLCAVMLMRPVPEDRFYSQIYLMLDSEMPRAAAPIGGLFE